MEARSFDARWSSRWKSVTLSGFVHSLHCAQCPKPKKHQENGVGGLTRVMKQLLASFVDVTGRRALAVAQRAARARLRSGGRAKGGLGA